MQQIKFGTDGWRAIIADDFTVENVKRVASATAKWMQSKDMHLAVIGFDCRFGGKLFAETTARVLAFYNIRSLVSHQFVSTPMVSLAVVQHKADMGIVITASHNPASYNGFKLKSSYGGPTIPADISAVEALIPDQFNTELESLETLTKNGTIAYLDLEEEYLAHVIRNFDIPLISKTCTLAYDAMYGAGQNVIRKLFPKATLFHCNNNPSFNGTAPEPIPRNLHEISKYLSTHPGYSGALTTDGDADRIGMLDPEGNFVDSHHLLLLLLYYLYEFKSYRGKVVVTFSVTDKMQILAKQYGCEIEVTKIGFKYIAEIMTKEDVLVAGEESGGLAIKGHIPERDGIWIGLTILEFMARTGKSLNALIQDVYAKVGSFAFDRLDLHLSMADKERIQSKLEQSSFSSLGGKQILRTETLDGYKYYLEGGSWIMIRPSGTEPVLRIYAQSHSLNEAKEILRIANTELLQ